MLRDGGVRSEFANMQREQNPTADLERLQMMEMTKAMFVISRISFGVKTVFVLKSSNIFF